MQHRRRRLIAALIALAFLVGAGIWFNPPDPAATDRLAAPAPIAVVPTHSQDPQPAPPALAPPDVSAIPRDAELDLLARWQRSSLRGTEVDGGIQLDAAGRLLLDLDLRRLFDHFLSLSGEFSDSEIRRLLGLHVEASHGSTVASAALEAFDRYLGLRNALAALPADAELAQRLAALQRLRREWFGDAADAMFGDDEAHTAYTLERLALLRDAELDEATRQERLAALEATRPASALDGQQAAVSALLAEEQTEQFDTLGASEAERRAERSALWGEDAADRLATLDRERAQWQQRLADYVRQRDRLANDPRLDAGARAAAIEALRRRSFADNERVRVESLEAIDALPRGG